MSTSVVKDERETSAENQPQSAAALDNDSKGPLVDLPTELHRAIAVLLSPQEVVCLALTCKTMYKVHEGYVSAVPLWLPGYHGRQLCSLLRDWIDPTHSMVMDTTTRKFISWETREATMKERYGKWRNVNGGHGLACAGCYDSVFGVVAEIRARRIEGRTWVYSNNIRP